MMSPAFRPAFAAGESSRTLLISTPPSTPKCSASCFRQGRDADADLAAAADAPRRSLHLGPPGARGKTCTFGIVASRGIAHVRGDRQRTGILNSKLPPIRTSASDAFAERGRNRSRSITRAKDGDLRLSGRVRSPIEQPRQLADARYIVAVDPDDNVVRPQAGGFAAGEPSMTFSIGYAAYRPKGRTWAKFSRVTSSVFDAEITGTAAERPGKRTRERLFARLLRLGRLADRRRSARPPAIIANDVRYLRTIRTSKDFR